MSEAKEMAFGMTIARINGRRTRPMFLAFSTSAKADAFVKSLSREPAAIERMGPHTVCVQASSDQHEKELSALVSARFYMIDNAVS